MEDLLFGWCFSHIPHITAAVVIIVLSIYLGWKANKSYNYWATKITTNELHANKIDAHIIPQLADIKTSLGTLLVYMKFKDNEFDPKLFMSKSPIRLTELGWKILEAIGGRKYVDDNADLLIQDMNAIGIKTALDSQTNAPIVITKHTNDDSFTPIKNYIFNNPFYRENDDNDTSVPLDLSTVTTVMGIYLRDKYLETRKELNVEDI